MRKFLLILSLVFSTSIISQTNDLTIQYEGTIQTKATDTKVASTSSYTSTQYLSKGKKLVVDIRPNLKSTVLTGNGNITAFLEYTLSTGKTYKSFAKKDLKELKNMPDIKKNYSPLVYTKEKKTILGYACTKVTLMRKDSTGNTYTIYGWLSDKLKVQDEDTLFNGDYGFHTKQMILEIEGEDDKKITHIIASAVSTKPIAKAVFNISTVGYTQIHAH
jgi:hypothetical protein